MFYGQCNDCGERWELGTAPTCKCPVEALAKPDFWEGYVPEPVKPATEESSATQAQQALDKKAENARELGLDYEPAQQEPAGWRPATFHRDNLTFNPGLPDEQTVKFWKLQGVEIEYCYTSPPASKPWVGLTDDEVINVIPDDDTPMSLGEAFSKFAELIEAKLKEKNNG